MSAATSGNTQSANRRDTPRAASGHGAVALLLLLTLTSPFGQPSTVNAWQTDPARAPVNEGAVLFPASTTLYVQLNEPGKLVQRMLDHPLRNRIEGLDPVRQRLEGPEFTQFKLGLGLLETRMGESWLPALQRLTESGVYIGLDAASQSAGLAIHSGDEALLGKTAGAILGFIKQNGDDFEVVDYKGGKLAELDEVTIARLDEWFLLSNQRDFLTSMADRLVQSRSGRGQPDPSLATTAEFQDAWSHRGGDSDAWTFANLATIRDVGQGNPLFAGSTDEPLVELLFGGILEALGGADFASARISVADRQIVARVRLPYDSTRSPRKREFFFGTRGEGRAPQPIEIDGLLAQAVTYRDLGNWWLSKEDLFPENVIADLAQGDSQLSTLFGGVDFGEEVLGALQPGMRLLVKEQTYPEGLKPDVTIPAFALVTRLQNPRDARRFRISFQSLVGLLNIDQSGMERPQIEIMTTKEDGIQITGGEYLPDDNLSEGLFIYNFSPALSFQDDYMIVSSSMDFAREIAEATRELGPPPASESNTRITLNAAPIREALAENRQTLIASTMVGQGLSPDEAGARIDLILDLLNHARDATLDYRVEPEAMSLDLELRLNDPR